MSEASSPVCPVTLYTPHGEDSHQPHPMVSLPAGLDLPFDLKVDPGVAVYHIGFHNLLTAADNPGSLGVRIFLSAFHANGPAIPIWSNTVRLAAQGDQHQELLPLAGENVPTTLLVGAWWDDGTFAADNLGIASYFAAHPAGGVHHTVPIRIG